MSSHATKRIVEGTAYAESVLALVFAFAVSSRTTVAPFGVVCVRADGDKSRGEEEGGDLHFSVRYVIGSG
jgi:hypothetical protein